MIVLHALWSLDSRLLVWSETTDAAGKRKRGRRIAREGPPRHPFACRSDALREAIEIASGELLADGATEVPLVLLLPTAAGAPLPSPRVARVRQAGTPPPRTELAPWLIDAWAFLPPDTLDLLLLLGATEIPEVPDVDLGDSMRYWIEVARRALEQVAQGNFLPFLSLDGDAYFAGWRPANRITEAAWFRALAVAMPPACRAFAQSGDDSFDTDSSARKVGAEHARRSAAHGSDGVAVVPEPGRIAGDEGDSSDSPASIRGLRASLLLERAFEALLDAAVRLSLDGESLLPSARRRRGTDPSAAAVAAWLDALVSADGVMRGDLDALEALRADLSLHANGGDAERRTAGGFRTCFRIAPPPETPPDPRGDVDASTAPVAEANGDEYWRVDFILQGLDDPSLLIEADQVWTNDGGWLRLEPNAEQQDVVQPQEKLLGDLGRARRIFPAIEVALRDSRPTGLELDSAGALRFLRETAPLLEQSGFGVMVPGWWRKPATRLGVKLVVQPREQDADTTGLGLLGLDALCAYEWKLSLGEEEIDPAEFQALAAMKVPLVRVQGRWVELDPHQVEAALKLLDARNGADNGPDDGADSDGMTASEVLRLATGAANGPGDLPVTAVEASGWMSALLDPSVGNESLGDTPMPDCFTGTLRPYQRRGLAWLDFLDRFGLGACLADDMGLGKTPQTLALLALDRERRLGASNPTGGAANTDPEARAAGKRRRPKGKNKGASRDGAPTLLICPMSLVGNWQREAARFTPDLRIHVHHGAERVSGDEFRAAALDSDVVITTYALAARDRTELASLKWRRIVLDEAQNIKNSAAKQTAAIRAIPAPRRIALTGTPVENRLAELWSILDFLNPGLLGSQAGFRRNFAIPIERYHDNEAASRLRRLSAPFILRRLKTDRSIIQDLPEKVEMTVFCNLTREQASLYQATVDEMLARIAASEGIERKGLVLSTMTRLKQICNHPAHLLRDRPDLDGDRSGKVARLEELLDEVLGLGERALVFTQYREMGELLEDHLQRRFGHEVLFLHGATSRKRRESMLQRFQSDDGPAIFLLSLKAGGTGLNLTAANHVIHFDRWWNPAVEDQATDRAFRIGQTRDVQVRKLVCVGTLEERIDQMIQEKKALAERIVGAGEAWLTELSTDRLRELVRLSADAVAE
ncbi:MAG: ATP-dependent helicase [Gemmatimonas sp.]|nr:ATP-dependent helicase [Gemmatimonas sp.]